MIDKVIGYFIAATFPLLMMSGLLSSPIILTLLLILLFKILGDWKLYDYKKLVLYELSSTEKAILLFFILALFSIQTPNIVYSLQKWLKVFSCILLGIVINHYYSNSNFNRERVDGIFKYLLIGIYGQIIIFLIEYYSDGYITRSLRGIFFPGKAYIFLLNELDTGCSILSLLFWPVCGWLYHYKRYFECVLIYVLIFSILWHSDSLSSCLAFIISSLSAVFLIITKFRIKRIFIYGTLTFCILMPIFAYLRPEYLLSENYPYLSDSAKHRLHIWKFTAIKIIKKPIFGFGYGASSKISYNLSDIFYYKQLKLLPMPLHPHNQVLQILLETGITGLLAFMLVIYRLLNSIINFKSLFLTRKDKKLWQLLSLAAFTNYFVIGAISYNMWQSWWIFISILLFLLISILKSKILVDVDAQNI